MPLPIKAIITPINREIRYGTVLKLHPSDREFQTEIEVAAGTTADPTLPSTSTTTRIAVKAPGITSHTHYLSNDGRTWHYRARHILPGSCDGPFTDYVCAKAVLISVADKRVPIGGGDEEKDEDELFMSEGRRRGDTLYANDQQLRKEVTVADTANAFGINRHNEDDQEEDGQAVTFVDNFDSVPRVVFIPQNARVFSTSLGTSPQTQFMLMQAQDPTVSGFTVRAVLQTSGSSTETTDGWSTAQNTAAPENGTVTLTNDGDVAFSNLEDATGTVTTYNAFFDVDTEFLNITNFMKVEFSYNSGATSTTFTLGASRNYPPDNFSTDEKLSFAAGLGSSFDLRLRTSYTNPPGATGVGVVTAHGESDSQPGVTYNVASGTVEETMTPSTGNNVLWQATEAP